LRRGEDVGTIKRKWQGEFFMIFGKIKNYLSEINCFLLRHMIGGLCIASLGGHARRDGVNGVGGEAVSSEPGAVVSDENSVGGQAVIEGVMMRSPRSIATAVRKANEEIITKKDPYIALSKRHKLFNIPVFRGALSFFEILVIGLKALNFSADVALEEAEKAAKGSDWQRTRGERIKDGFILAGTIVLALGLALGVFFALPLFLTDVMGLPKNAFSFNVTAGIIRVSFFVAYLWGIGRWKEIKRILEYHGAEHKSIYAFESGQELTVENVRRHSTHHPRCGTSFLLIVVILAILLFAIADTIVEMQIGHRPTLLQRFITHFSLLPLLGGISFELLKLSGKKRDNRYIRWLSLPGLWLQKITTQEPDDTQLEVAIVALKSALEKT
jgi:uncharacterized protein YqhQ